MSNVKVRVETPVFGYQWHQEVELTRTDLVDACIREGRFTVIEELSDPTVTQDVSVPSVDVDLKGELLDAALEAAGLPKTGSAADKRSRLAAHQATEAAAAAARQEQEQGAS